MTEHYQQQNGNEELWKTLFGEGDPKLHKMHWLYTKLPTEPRCRLCLVPFKGLGGWIMRKRGKAPNSRNPNYCSACDQLLEAFPGGAEVNMSILYVDIRKSTEYSQHHETAEVSRRINIFLNRVTKAIINNDGFVMAFYGDCVVAAWPPGFSGRDHAIKVFRTAQSLVRSKDMVDANGEVIPIGVGVHSGAVYISSVSAMQGSFRDVSIFGSNVNLAARLATHAAPSQALATREHIIAAGQKPESFESESVELKGFEQPVEVCQIG